MGYADMGLRRALATGLPARDMLRWLKRRDRLTRATMIQYINLRWPAVEALEKALQETEVSWQIGVPDLTNVVAEREMHLKSRSRSPSPRRPRRSRSPPRRRSRSPLSRTAARSSRSQAQSSGKKGGSDTKLPKMVSTLPKGRPLCRDFNMGKCTKNEGKCPKNHWHRCAKQLKDGRACGERHRAISCDRS